jgi:Domain of unknown function (DUF4268)
MSGVELGSLERLDARQVWKNEAYDFTPWLRANVDLLGQALGIEIDPDVQQEVAVGLFSADLLGTDLGSQAAILIENQLEQTDHSHLGQLLTYAGGLDSKILVWLSPSVREEHRQALIWLNENTVEDVLFFGVEIELLRIDGSKPAPHFKVVAAPNEWQKSKRVRVVGGAAPQTSERNERYREFWKGVIADIRHREPGFTSTTPERAPRQNWCAFSAGRTGFLDGLVFGYEEGMAVVRTELYIDVGEANQNKAAFDALYAQKELVEAAFGEQLVWTRRDDIRASRIYLARPGALDDPADQLQQHRAWFVEKALRLRAVFGPLIKPLDLIAGAQNVEAHAIEGEGEPA